MSSTVQFDTPLAKTIMLLAAVGLLIWIISKQCNWGGAKPMYIAPAEAFELEPVTFGMEDFEDEDAEYFEDEDGGMEGFEDDEPEGYENDEDMEGYEDDEMEGFEDDGPEEYNDDEYE